MTTVTEEAGQVQHCYSFVVLILFVNTFIFDSSAKRDKGHVVPAQKFKYDSLINGKTCEGFSANLLALKHVLISTFTVADLRLRIQEISNQHKLQFDYLALIVTSKSLPNFYSRYHTVYFPFSVEFAAEKRSIPG